MKTENARRFADLESQHERARAWEEVSPCLRCCADGWPEYLTVDEIAFLHARGEGGRTDSGKQAVLADYLGRCLEYDDLSAERIKRRERVPSELGMGDDPETWFVEREVIRVRDCSRVLAGVELGPYLRHWLAPYRCAEKLAPTTAQADAHQRKVPAEIDQPTPMRLAAVIVRLGRKYPKLSSAINRGEEWATACRTGRRGWYYFEHLEKECQARYGSAAQPSRGADLSLATQLRAACK